MKYLLYCILILSLFSCKEKSESKEPVVTFNKSDLSKMKWIEGNWVGDYKGQPFYETYGMINDSTIRIMNYSNVGTDSASATMDLIFWKEGQYYMGEGSKYKIVELTDKDVKMIPLNASNDIVWSFENDTTWTAVLSGKTDTARYTLKKVPAEIESLLQAIRSKSE